MATRSTIAIELGSGEVLQVYCHWDGYISHNGKMLVNHYNDELSIIKLLSKGYISSLKETIATSEFINDKHNEETSVNRFASYKDYIANNDGQEFDYIFKNGEWKVRIYGSRRLALVSNQLKKGE